MPKFAVTVNAQAVVSCVVHVEAGTEMLAKAIANLAVRQNLDTPKWKPGEVQPDSVAVVGAEEMPEHDFQKDGSRMICARCGLIQTRNTGDVPCVGPQVIAGRFQLGNVAEGATG